MTLHDELEQALELAVVGQPSGPGLAGRAATAARAVLLRRGLARARVEARAAGAGVEVTVLLPGQGPRVERLRLHVETA